jgi:hypothetical protein
MASPQPIDGEGNHNPGAKERPFVRPAVPPPDRRRPASGEAADKARGQPVRDSLGTRERDRGSGWVSSDRGLTWRLIPSVAGGED